MSQPRIRSGSAKIGLAVSVVILVTFLAFGVGLVDFEAGYALALVVTVAAVVISSRIFRGAAESDGPRKWWVMTAAPASSVVLAVLFFFRGGIGVFEIARGSSPSSITLWGTGILLLVAAAYFNSAIRLGGKTASETSRTP